MHETVIERPRISRLLAEDIGVAECHVAVGILVEQGVMEKPAGATEGSLLRHDCHFSQMGCAFVRIEQTGQQIGAGAG